ncbi:MAG: chemotaxis protein CheW [Pseudomonadota bacterium]
MSHNPPAFQRWISFSLAGQSYGVDIGRVREVLAEVQIEPVPGAPQAVLGVINLRGQIVTVLDLRAWLGRERSSRVVRVMVLEHAGAMLGLAVDAVSDVLRLTSDDIKPVPRSREGQQPDFIQGLVTREDGLLTLVSFDALLATECLNTA